MFDCCMFKFKHRIFAAVISIQIYYSFKIKSMLVTTMAKIGRMIADAQAEDDYNRESTLLTLCEDLQEITGDVNFQLQMAANTDAAIDKLGDLCEKALINMFAPDLTVFHIAALRMMINNDVQNFMFKNASN